MRKAPAFAPALAAAALVLGCTGGKNNRPSAATTLAPAVTTTIARTAAPPTAAPRSAATPVATLPPTPRATPAGTSAARAAAAPTPTPLPLGAGAARDAGLQQQLDGVALTPADLPAGYVQAGDADRDLNDPAEVAAYALTYTRVDQGAAAMPILALYDGLTGFKDAATAQTQLRSLPQNFAQNAGSDFQVQPVPNGPALGDEAQSFKVGGQANGLAVSGYAIIWRRGRLAAVVILVGMPASPSLDDVAAIARKQDVRLQGVR